MDARKDVRKERKKKEEEGERKGERRKGVHQEWRDGGESTGEQRGGGYKQRRRGAVKRGQGMRGEVVGVEGSHVFAETETTVDNLASVPFVLRRTRSLFQ